MKHALLKLVFLCGTIATASAVFAAADNTYAKCVREVLNSKPEQLVPADIWKCNLLVGLESTSDEASPEQIASEDAAAATDAAADQYDTPSAWSYEPTLLRDGREWHYVGASSTKAELYVDMSSIAIRDGFVQAWFLTDAKSDRTVKWRYAKHLQVVDCTKNLISENAFVAYDPGGRAVFTDDWQINRWQNVIPDSMADLMAQRLCR